jgi:D-glycero-D-manno-heptose 1,7-bisphosphate phosphatase
MKRAAVFFDRDNTLIRSDGYLGNPEEVKLLEGAADAIARARRLGYAAITVSNQSGVARGLFTEDAVRAVNRRMDDLLKLQVPMAIIDAHEFCPFHPEATVAQYKKDSELRKPKAGMIFRAAQNLSLDLSRSWMIGDAPRDIEAGHAAGCRTILFKDPALPASPAASEAIKVEPDFVVGSLKEAMDIIERHTPRRGIASSFPLTPAPAPAPSEEPGKQEKLLEQILLELKRRDEAPAMEFSISKLLAGIVQILVLPVLFFAYLHLGDPSLVGLMLLAIFMETLVIALLVMGRQK